ncbi:MAG: YaiI/YqxD family protein, partial [Pseudomonadota bacterium]
MRILVDGDACPVKDEVFKVSARTGIAVTVVSNRRLRLPDDALIDQIVVDADPDAADDQIAALAGPSTIVITADIPLADRALKADAVALAPNGKPFTASSIGSAMAMRALMQDLRAGGEQMGGPPPFTRRDRSTCLQALDAA